MLQVAFPKLHLKIHLSSIVEHMYATKQQSKGSALETTSISNREDQKLLVIKYKSSQHTLYSTNTYYLSLTAKLIILIRPVSVPLALQASGSSSAPPEGIQKFME